MTSRHLPTSDEFGQSLAAAIADVPRAFGLDGIPTVPIAVRRLGMGETYQAWACDVGRDALPEAARRDAAGTIVVRVPVRPLGDAELGRLGNEAETLGRVPDGLGPYHLAHVRPDESPLGQHLLVQTLVPGRVIPPSSWTDDLLRTHARNLARLHETRRATRLPYWDDAQPETMDPSVEYDAARGWWRSEHPHLLEIPGVAKLLDPVGEYVAAAAPSFEGITFALTHGDAVNSNILVDGERLAYVDWEWAQFQDPARDLGLLGAPTGASPWYLALDEARERAFVEAYAEAGGAQGVDDVDRLITRRRVWEVMEQFFTAIHFLGRLDLHPPAGAKPVGVGPLDARQRPVHERATRSMLLSVQQRLLDARG